LGDHQGIQTIESCNSLGRIEEYTFCFRPGTLNDPDEIKGVWLHLPNGLMAWFVRVHHWRKTSPETGVRSAEDQGQEKAAEPLALVDTIPLQFLETRYQPNPD
jgi:hypothetical protein